MNCTAAFRQSCASTCEDYRTLEESSLNSGELLVTIALCVAYSFVVLSLLLYFLIERGFLHRSRQVETCFLNFLLELIIVATVVWEDVVAVPNFYLGSTVLTLRQLSLLVIVIQIRLHMADMDVIEPFFNGKGERQAARIWVGEPAPRARRIACELSTAVARGRGRSGPRVVERLLPGVLLFFYMLQDTALVFYRSLDVSFTPFILLFFAVLLLHRFVRFCYHERCMAKLIDEYIGDILKYHNESTLAYVLASVNIGALLDVSPQSLQRLAGHALERGLLDTLSKAILVDALQKQCTRVLFIAEESQAALNLILSCKGTELTVFKNLIDGGCNQYNLYKLVFTNIPRGVMRDAVVEHMQEEGLKLRQSLGRRAGVKVVSDIDDTFLCSGGSFPAGFHEAYPKGMIYPGCARLFSCLEISYIGGMPSCNIVFLSARPHMYKGVTEYHSYSKFANLVKEGLLRSFPTLLPGELSRGAWATLLYGCLGIRAWRPIGNFKYLTLTRFMQLYVEYDYIFCGDNGQGDLLVGQRMLAFDAKDDAGTWHGPTLPEDVIEERGVLQAVLIHEVLPDGASVLEAEPSECVCDADSDGHFRSPLFFHKSYVGAAVDLHLANPSLLSAESVASVASDAILEFDNARWTYMRFGESCWAAAERVLQADLHRAKAIVNAAKLAPLGPLMSYAAVVAPLHLCSDSEESSVDADDAPVHEHLGG